MTPVTCERTSTEREAAACPTYSKRAVTVSGTTVRTDTSGGGGAALATGARQRAAAAPTRSSATATAAVHVAGLIKRVMRIPAGEGDDYRVDSAGMNYACAKFPRIRRVRSGSPIWVGPHHPAGGGRGELRDHPGHCCRMNVSRIVKRNDT